MKYPIDGSYVSPASSTKPGSMSTDDYIKLDTLENRENHTGTQLASTISNFDTQVRTSRLDQMAAPTSAISLNSQKITNLATPTATTDATNKSYVDSKTGLTPQYVHATKGGTAQSGLLSGTTYKVTFPTEVSDTSNVWDAANSRYAPGRVTRAILTGQVYLYLPAGTPANGSQASVSLYKNGTTIVDDNRQNFSVVANGIAQVQFTFIADATVLTDYFELVINQASGSSATIDGGTTATHLKIQELPLGSIKGEQGIAGTAGAPSLGKYVRLTNQTIATGATNSAILWNDSHYLQNSPVTLNSGTGVFTVNDKSTSGFIRINAKVLWASTTSTARRYLSIVKNGVVVGYGEDIGGVSGFITNSVNDVYPATLGDTFTITVSQLTGGNLDLQADGNGAYCNVIFSVEQGGPQGPQGPAGGSGPPIISSRYVLVSSQTITNNTQTNIYWQNVTFTGPSNPVTYNPTNASFLVNSNFTGSYLRINAKGSWEAGTGRRIIGVYKNGVQVTSAEAVGPGASQFVTCTVSDVIHVAVGDTLEFKAYQNSGASVNLYGSADGAYTSVVMSQEQGGPAGPAGPSGAAGPAIVAKFSKSAAQTITSTGGTDIANRITYNTTEFATTPSPVSLNTTTGVFTVNSGFTFTALDISVNLRWDHSTGSLGRRLAVLYKNGNIVGEGEASGNNSAYQYIASTINTVLTAVPGDQFYIVAYQDSGTSKNVLTGVNNSISFSVVQGGAAGPAGDVGTTRFIGSITALGGETSFTLPFPSGVGRNIILKGTARGTTNALNDNLIIKFNNSSTASDYQQVYISGVNNSTPTTTTNNAIGGAFLAPIPALTAPASVYGSFTATIHDYQKSFHKEIISVGARSTANDGTSSAIVMYTHRFAQTAAITSMAVSMASGGEFAAGSTIAVYVEVDAASGAGLPGNVLSVAGSSLILASNQLSSPKLDNLYTPTNNTGTASATNLNTISASGFYEAVPSTANMPSVTITGAISGYWHVHHIEYTASSSAKYAHQRAYPFLLQNTSGWAERHCYAGTWTPWVYYGEDVPWTNVTLGGTITAVSGNVPRYRVLGGKKVELRGRATFAGTGDLAGWGLTGNIPAIAPATQKTFPLTQPQGNAYWMVQPGVGAVETFAVTGGSGAPTAGRQLSFEGITYMLD